MKKFIYILINSFQLRTLNKTHTQLNRLKHLHSVIQSYTYLTKMTLLLTYDYLLFSIFFQNTNQILLHYYIHFHYYSCVAIF